ncbi:MAG: RagB/SusD family nutrient uptake outer membrane protein [Bacteroidales bacterium]|jgi:hypothetical protein|nr:RagB/SusD family nutrient uptake outer membrane protein [Bacteroidales bacterium]
MKKIHIYLLSAILFAGFLSCTKFLDRKSPMTLSPEDAYNTVEKCGYAIGGLMDNFTSYGYIGRNLTIYGDLFCDNVTTVRSHSGHFYDVENWNISTSHQDVSTIWGNSYIIAARAVDAIIGINKLIAEGGDIKRLEVYKGAALSIKVYCEWILAQYFCLPYNEENKTTNGIILIGDSKIGIEEEVHTSNLGDTYKQMVSEIDTVIALYTRNDTKIVSYNTSPNWAYLPSLSMAYILKSRIMLDMGRYAEAINACDLALSSITDKKIVSTVAELKEMYKAEATPTPEEIWTVYFDISTQLSANAINNFYSSYGAWISEPVRKLFYEKTPLLSDIRYVLYRDTVLVEDSVFSFCGKYPNKNNVNNVPIMRLPEIYYNKAEAQAKSGDVSGAKNTIFEVISKRNPLVTDIAAMETIYSTGNTENEFIDFLLSDRRREFAGEGLRWFDLRRNSRRLTREIIEGKVSFRKTFTNYPLSKTCLPIPNAETDTRQWGGKQNEIWFSGSPTIPLPSEGEDYTDKY